MREIIEETQATAHEINVGEHGEHSAEQHPIRWNKRIVLTTGAILLLGAIATIALWTRGAMPGQTAAPQIEAKSGAETARLGVAVATDEQMQQITVEAVTEHALDEER